MKKTLLILSCIFVYFSLGFFIGRITYNPNCPKDLSKALAGCEFVSSTIMEATTLCERKLRQCYYILDVVSSKE